MTHLSSDLSYYNENDPKAAAWLREMIKAGAIAPGEVDDRDIRDITPADLRGFRQCHFFAGIGVWSYSLRLAGWPDSRPVWTGSCPCQPFSAAGKGAGFDDQRHLWPDWFHLIALCGPGILFGEQVASKDGLAWLDLVLADMEAAQYAVGAFDLCAAGVGAPHIRQRLYFVAESSIERRQGIGLHVQPGAPRFDLAEAGRRREAGRLADPYGRHAGAEREQRGGEQRLEQAHGDAGELGQPKRTGLEGHAGDGDYPRGRSFALGSVATSGAVGGHWRNAEVVFCRDGKLRPVEPGSFPLAHGAPARVGRLRGYGNAIVAPLAAEVIAAYMEDAA